MSEEESYVAPRDPFYRGILLRFARGTGLGVVRSATSGREVGFELQHVLVLGEGGVESLREGIPVGYDVGWTSRGLRVTKLFPLKEEESSGT